MHVPVLLNEVIEYLSLQPGAKVIDCNVGSGGHAKKILTKLGLSGRLLGIDRDAMAIKTAAKQLSRYQKQLDLVQANFDNLSEIALAHDFTDVNGILFDLGLSSMQLDAEGRGFSWRRDEPLDMRMDQGQGLSAAELIKDSSENDLVKIFSEYGEVRFAKSLARAIVAARQTHRLDSTQQLADLIADVAPSRSRGRVNPATQAFQALRIAVNDELNQLKRALPQALHLLKPGGRLVVISFHSLEDRIVKNFFRQESKDCVCSDELPVCRCDHRQQLKILNKKPVIPKESEIKINPRSRSAKLRVAEKLK